jgi:Mg2+-importing ATPase
LIASCLAAVAVGTYLPFSPLAGVLGFTPLPASYFGFVAIATAVYLVMVEAAKRLLLRRAAKKNATPQRGTFALAT